MKTILRMLIVWLVLLSIPFQGIAAAAVLPCASCVHGPAAHADHPQASSHHAATTQAPAHDSCGEHHAKCSNCADSCLGAAIAPPLSPAIVAHAPVAFSIPFDAGYLPSVDLDHPERPPRFPRA